MLKVMHVISDSNIGGAGKYLINYLENCNTKRFNVKIVLPNNSKLIDEVKKLGFEYIEIDGLAEKSYSKIAFKKLKEIFAHEKPDIVHSHACLSARIAAKTCNAKIIYTRHTDSALSKKLTNPIGKLINRIINEYFADGIIAVSNTAKENLLKTGVSKKKVTVIYNGVRPVKRMEESERKKVFEFFNLPYECKIIGIVARLEEIKGHEYFIDAAKIVAKKGYDAKFVIAGTGSRENYLKEYVKKNNVNNIVFLGFVSNVYELNNIMHVQVNASSYEALGLSILEGMRLGVPAVVSSYGGNPEVTQNGVNGYVINGQDPEEFAKKIILMLKNDEVYKKLSDGCIDIFNKKFTASMMAENTENFYLHIMEGKK